MNFLHLIITLIVFGTYECCNINEKDFDNLVRISSEAYKFEKPTTVTLYFDKNCYAGTIFSIKFIIKF